MPVILLYYCVIITLGSIQITHQTWLGFRLVMFQPVGMLENSYFEF